MQIRHAQPLNYPHALHKMGISFRLAAAVLTSMLGLAALTSASAQTGSITSSLKLPSGFRVTEYASGFQNPRLLAVAPNGDLFVSDMRAGMVYVLPDRNRDGRPEAKAAFATGLNQPHGLAFRNGYLYVANTDAVVRFAYKTGDKKASTSRPSPPSASLEGRASSPGLEE